MMELTLYGRGGQGGVTLAKLVAETYFFRGRFVQAFGVYAAERSGAPVQAYVRVDEEEITNHNEIREPNHVIVLDRTLIGPRVTVGLQPNGWLILNTPEPPKAFERDFAGRNIATIDATSIAASHGLGTRAVPIVNTTLMGAAAKVFGLPFADVEAAMAALKFGGANLDSARQAYDGVIAEKLGGEIQATSAPAVSSRIADLLDPDVGAAPALRTGSWATRRPERRTLEPPCNHACPAGNDVQAFVNATSKQDYDGALEVLLRTSPFPAVCGRVCPAPCMEACNRRSFDEAVNVRELERYVADVGLRKRSTAPEREERVAIVGSGPAGLSAAYTLGRLGYSVMLFEAGEELGGLLRTGIPSYRLPRPVLDREIRFILSHGVEARTGHRVTRAELLKLSHNHSAVFVATGLQEARSLDLGLERGCSDGRVEQGIDFLDRVRNENPLSPGEKVVVIGGGNTAIDAARSAVRLGAGHVSILYRRSRSEMPAIAEEIDAAAEEGVELSELTSPLRVREMGDRLLLTCQRMKLGPPDKSGRAAAIPETTDDAFFDVLCDRVILALGQSADLSVLPKGTKICDGSASLGESGAPIYCGGDFATNDGTVSAAIGQGRIAALRIHKTISGEDLLPPPAPKVAGLEDLHTHAFAHASRHAGETIRPSLRRHTFDEVHIGFAAHDGEDVAAVEAARCFSCGVCNTCDRCRQYCPEGIVRRDGNGYCFDYDYCKGCGVCAVECPRGVIQLAEL